MKLHYRNLFHLMLFAVCLMQTGSLMAQRIPPGRELDVLDLFRPYSVESPADQLPDGALLDSVAIKPETVEVTLLRGEESATLTVHMRGTVNEDVWGTTNSFDVVWPEAVDASKEMNHGANELLEVLRRNDSGAFWEEVPDAAPELTLLERIQLETDTTFGFKDFIGELTLLLFLLALALALPTLGRSLPTTHWKFWLAIVLVTLAGVWLRLGLGPGQHDYETVPLEHCVDHKECNDHNTCTQDRCIEQRCTFEWAPGGNQNCCQNDADCPESVDACVEDLCNLDTNLCRSSTRVECDLGPYFGRSGPSLLSSVGWLYAIPAKWMQWEGDEAQRFQAVCSGLVALLLGLFLLLWTGDARLGCLSACIYAFQPISIMTAQSASVSGIILLLTLIVLIAWHVRLHLDRPTFLQKAALHGVLWVSFFWIVASRFEFVLLLPLLWVMYVRSTHPPLSRTEWVLASSLGLLSSIAGAVLLAANGHISIYPPIRQNFRFAAIESAFDGITASGLAFPGLVFALLVLGGFVVLFFRHRFLFFLSTTLLAILLVQVFLFDANNFQTLRYSLVPMLGAVIPAAAALTAILSSKQRLLRVAAVLMTVYLMAYPIVNQSAMASHTRLSTIRSLFFEW